MGPAHAPDDGRQDVSCDQLAGGEAYRAIDGERFASRGQRDASGRVAHRPEVLHQIQTGRGELDGVADPLEERNAKLLFEGRDLPPDGGLGDVQDPAGSRERALFCGDEEGARVGPVETNRAPVHALTHSTAAFSPIARSPVQAQSDPMKNDSTTAPERKKVCIVGASGKLGRYMVQHALDRGYEVVGVCRPESVAKLDAFKGRITVVPAPTDARDAIWRAVAGCDAVLTVLAPMGVRQYASRTAQAVLDLAPERARLVFSCGWHITLDGQDTYSRLFLTVVKVAGWVARIARYGDIDDQVAACRRIFESERLWTVVRGSNVEEGESQGLPVWSGHVGDPILKSN